ncbi:MAG: 5-formyltetrahydrofolate cyclo-ligase [Deltaproteobacteria bacterium]|nr:5-formyltetrahydrofolate cyclo-ligase [Deltaproteobacteria bacterium]
MREDMRRLCLAVSREEAEGSARRATEKLGTHTAFQNAKRLVVHLGLPDELPTSPVVALARATHKPVLVPRVIARNQLEFVPLAKDCELQRSALGVEEPAASVPAEVLAPGDLLLVPGLAFDPQGGRLGRGAGYYDRALKEVRSLGVEVMGWAYSFQLVAQVPMEDHDQRVSSLITDAE